LLQERDALEVLDVKVHHCLWGQDERVEIVSSLQLESPAKAAVVEEMRFDLSVLTNDFYNIGFSGVGSYSWRHINRDWGSRLLLLFSNCLPKMLRNLSRSYEQVLLRIRRQMGRLLGIVEHRWLERVGLLLTEEFSSEAGLFLSV